MPIYEYHCKDCNKTFEEIVASSATSNPACPACSSRNTEKLMSRIGGINMVTGGHNACPSGGKCPGESACGCGPGGCCAGM